jgi:hypothetical protein
VVPNQKHDLLVRPTCGSYPLERELASRGPVPLCAALRRQPTMRFSPESCPGRTAAALYGVVLTPSSCSMLSRPVCVVSSVLRSPPPRARHGGVVVFALNRTPLVWFR